MAPTVTRLYDDGSVEVNGRRLRPDTSAPLVVELHENFHTVKLTYDGDNPNALTQRLIQLACAVLADPALAERLIVAATDEDFLLFNIAEMKEWRHDVA